MLLGLDTGGSFTDAVLLDQGRQVMCSAKSPTTPGRLQSGLGRAVTSVLQKAVEQRAEFHPGLIELVSLSTTLATNALVEGHGRPAALVLIGYDEPLLSRAGLKAALGDQPLLMIAGSHGADGVESEPLDVSALEQGLQAMPEHIEAIAVSGMFSVRNPAHERAARNLIAARSDLPVSCGHELSAALDAPRRALTALLNARLLGLINDLLLDCERMLAEQGIDAPLMVVRGDGSLVNASTARLQPVETILSGPAASVVGAGFLAGASEAPARLIADIGGTTTDIALLGRDGTPRLATRGARVGGWRTMVQAIDVNTIGLGGDSAVRFDREARQLAVGPDRAVPLSRLAAFWPEAITTMQAQLDHPWGRTHDGQFVVPLPLEGAESLPMPQGLSPAQRELLDRIRKGPLPLHTLFADQTLERPLFRLIARGLARLCCFTPTDASHLLGEQSDWDSRGAELGARLLQRYAQLNLGPDWPDVETVARAAKARLADTAALALFETLLAALPQLRREDQDGLAHSQRALLQAGFHGGVRMDQLEGLAGAFEFRASLKLPLIGLGASAAAHLPLAALRLNGRLQVPVHADVANAVGAVVGLVRQQVETTLLPIGSGIGDGPVRVLLADGAVDCENRAAAIAVAEAALQQQARALALAAGAGEVVTQTQREDTLVEKDGSTVYFGSRLVVIAGGRPALNV